MTARLPRLEQLPPLAIILDMDGLMVDSEPLWYRVEGEFCNARGGVWTPELALSLVGRGLATTLQTIAETFGIPIDPERDARLVVDTFIARVSELELKPGCRELLDGAAAAGLPLAVASSSSPRLIAAVLDRFDLAPRFRAVISGESVARPKPAPDIFLRAAEALGAPADRCVVLEDSLAGATAGRAAGTTVIAVPEGAWEGRGFEAVADAIVTDLHEAWRLIG